MENNGIIDSPQLVALDQATWNVNTFKIVQQPQ